MRVIAGTARGMRLQAPRGLAVRPTSDRLREALFSVVGSEVAGSAWWDACAGTGAVGIEALSRGARQVVFSEPERPALAVLRRNLAAVRLEERARVLERRWDRALDALAARGEVFDVIYYDPPYDRAETSRWLAAAPAVLAPSGLVLVEHRRGDAPAGERDLVTLRTLVAGSSAITFLARC